MENNNQLSTEEISKAKINKPKELKDFEAYSHFKSNIINYKKNCGDPITEFSYYCFSCKHSVCSECGVFEHKDHLLIQRDNCLKYDTTFFTEISKVIDDALEIKNKKEEIKTVIRTSIERLKEKLEEIENTKINEVNALFADIDSNLVELKKNYLDVKKTIEHYYKQNEKFFNIAKGNVDLENTVFLMNFELMNLCDNKNLDVLDSINAIKSRINDYSSLVDTRTANIENEIEHYLDIDYALEKFDDFYWDVKLRANKYNEHIAQFRTSVFDIFKRNGNFEKLKDLLEIFDSKHKKGKDVLFNQEFFLNNTESNRLMKVRGNSKSKLLTPSKSGNLPTNKNLNGCNSNPNLHTFHNTKTNLSASTPYLSNKDIILDTRTIQRFFAYTIMELYNKYFRNIDPAAKSSHNSSFSTNFLSNYTDRYNRLKEYAKPIIGTNQISLYNVLLNKITRVPVPLTKEEHGYVFFPDGARHILVNNVLYITGGVDSINNPINICLSFDIETHELSRISNLNFPHSYHTVEYLDNYDCIILVGGEHNPTCEIFDIYSSKWTKMPELNYPRANVNIYFDVITSDLYAMFGMKGDIVEKKNNSDVIEVLELNDIKSGWLKVDYYKSADLNFKINYCTVLPFTRDKLLIYGGNNPRVYKKLFALFNMAKNEVMKVDTQTMEAIKIEEKRIKMTDMALAKIN